MAVNQWSKSTMKICLFLLSLVSVVAAHNYYVQSTSNSCDGYNLCENLQHYTANQGKYFTNNTTFIFLPGTHILSESISLQHVTNLALMAHSNDTTEILCKGSGGLVFQDASQIKIVKLLFLNCSQTLPESLWRNGKTAQAALAFGEVIDLLLDSVSVSHSAGYGLLGHCVYGNFTTTHSTFSYNKGSTQCSGGNAIIEYINCIQEEPKCNLLISYSKFTNGSDFGTYKAARELDATGLTLILYQSSINATLIHVTMDGNKNNIYRANGGNLFIHIYNPKSFTSNNVTISHSRFVHGTSQLGAGIAIVIFMNSTSPHHLLCTNIINIHNTTISKNSGIFGAGLYYEFQLYKPYPCCPSEHSCCPFTNFTIWNTTFDENTILVPPDNPFSYLGNGVAVHMVAKYYKNKVVNGLDNHYITKFENCTFKHSHSLLSESRKESGTIFFTMMTLVTINMDYFFSGCNVTNNTVTAISLYKAKIILQSKIIIANNTGINGGGMILCESSYLILSKHTKILLINNHALKTGGALYIETTCQYTQPFCFYQLDSSTQWDSKTSATVHITMINNTAGYAGDHIFGGDIDSCKAFDFKSTQLFNTLFRISPNQTDSYLSAVTSTAKKICFCDDNLKPKCTLKNKQLSEAKYPGELVNVSVVTVGQLNGTVPGTVSYHTLQSDLMVTITGRRCINISIPAIAKGLANSTTELFLSSKLLSSSGNITSLSAARIRVTIPLKDCPCGFQYRNSNICECNDILHENGIACHIQNHTVQRIPPSWIGSLNSDSGLCSGIVYAAVCPYDYCTDSILYIKSNETVLEQDSQCVSNRHGLLCGKCKDGLGLSVGTSDCIKCNTKISVPLLLLGYGLAGPLLIFILLTLNMTYTDGTFSGMLFYANVITTNGFIFLTPHKIYTVFIILISWMSLNIGIRVCFYEGMDTYAKVWLEFFFPMYLFSLIAVITVLCRKSQRISLLIGGNIIKVLATLFQLSYTKLLETVAAALSFTEVQYHITRNSTKLTKRVWLADPGLDYFQGKHIPLALVAIVFGALILAYTLVLLFIQPLQRYSHLHCFTWVAKLKPLIDAYTAPHIIKDNCRYWEGLLLLFRLILIIIYSSNVHSFVDINLTAIVSICVLLLTIAWCTGGVYKKLYLNLLNSSYIVNVTAISLATIYRNKLQHHYNYILYTSYGIAIATLIVVLVCYVILAVKNCYSKCKRSKYEPLPLNDMDTDFAANIHARQF